MTKTLSILLAAAAAAIASMLLGNGLSSAPSPATTRVAWEQPPYRPRPGDEIIIIKGVEPVRSAQLAWEQPPYRPRPGDEIIIIKGTQSRALLNA